MAVTSRLASLALAFAISTTTAQAQTSFVEAALFFLTSIEPSQNDTVDDDEIVLADFPLAAYSVPEDQCLIRLRRTRAPFTTWQFNFCIVTGFELHTEPPAPGVRVWWKGKPGVFCSRETAREGKIEGLKFGGRCDIPMTGNALTNPGPPYVYITNGTKRYEGRRFLSTAELGSAERTESLSGYPRRNIDAYRYIAETFLGAEFKPY